MDDGIATIIAAGIAAVISLVSSGVALHAANKSNKSAEQSNEVTNRTNREIAMAEQDAENKRNDIQIDANIVWTARVEWIQNVRNLTAEFISAVNNYILSDNIELRKRNFEIVWEKSRLLILYFGPDADGLVDDNSNILDKHSNKAKNEKIVKLIQDICDGTETYFLNLQWISQHESSLSRCKECKDSEYIFETCEIIECGQLSADEQNRKCESYKNYNMECVHKYVVQNNEFKSKITTLIEAMRIYLKIEWNRTKERKET